jgi:hypothetical protein
MHIVHYKTYLYLSNCVFFSISNLSVMKPRNVHTYCMYSSACINQCTYTLLWRACNLNAFAPCLTGPVVLLFAFCHQDPVFNPQGGTFVKLGFSC